MPNLMNYTPFPNFRYYSSDNEGKDFGIIIVKATFNILPDGAIVLSEEQAPMVFSDKFHGEINESSLWYPSDLVARKDGTDIIINAVAYAPEKQGSKEWTCGVSIFGSDFKLEKKIKIFGSRQWRPIWKKPLSEEQKNNWKEYRDLFDRWELSEPIPIKKLTIRYEHAFGDIRQSGIDQNNKPIYEDYGVNPIGKGWLHPQWSNHTISYPAPQIESMSEPISDPYYKYKSEGLGPIPAAWEPRLPKAGTYDDNWLENIWPNWPSDYHFSFNNSANPSLITPHYLNGNEEIHLFSLWEDKNIIIKLPCVELKVIFKDHLDEIIEKTMNLDTVFLDIGYDEIADRHIFLSWRVLFEQNAYKQAIISFAHPMSQLNNQDLNKSVSL